MNYKIPFLLASLGTAVSHAQDADLAIQLSNPVADLNSVPIQSNFDFGIGAGDGTRWTTNIQPVIPFGRNDDLTLISQTILPIINVEGVAPCGVGDASGMGDILKSFFFAPNGADPIWGIGPVFLIPTVTDSLLGGEKWGIGPTAVITKQEDPLTYGVLANHLWDFAKDDSRASVNSTFLQPFVSYATPNATTFSANVESSYDWNQAQWNAVELRRQPVDEDRRPASAVLRRSLLLP
jgi:hypothetical protein